MLFFNKLPSNSENMRNKKYNDLPKQTYTSASHMTTTSEYLKIMNRLDLKPMLMRTILLFSTLLLGSLATAQLPPEERTIPGPEEDKGSLSFFITSVGVGNGGDLGGLAGADAHCESLADAVGAGDRLWRAYLSTQAFDGQEAINAIDRIGQGPWYNANGTRVAESPEALTYDNSGINYWSALNEKGEYITSLSMGDEHNQKDIMTGSKMDGTAMDPTENTTCSNWTSNDEGTAQSGHHDRFFWYVWGSSWNSAHASRGCSQEGLRGSGGDGLFYCFAAD